MITLLIGKKGSGKTKKLIELANEAVQNSNGNVVVIEKGLKLTYDISHKARLVDSDAYGIEGLDALVGFVSGICAANYDVTDVFVDSTLKITGNILVVYVSDQLRHEICCGTYTTYCAVAHGSIQQSILAAEYLEVHVSVSADELRSLGDITAGILHTYDVRNLMSQSVNQISGKGVAYTSRVVVKQYRSLRDCVCDCFEVSEQLGLSWL